jgi:hypothetical protein
MPATLINSRKNLGLLLTHKTFRTQLLLCRKCATSQVVTDLIFTVILGWWSIMSVFVNVGCIADDIAELSTIRNMEQPAEAIGSGGEAT